jgi:ParB-like chromosome segregation protein Spo0J
MMKVNWVEDFGAEFTLRRLGITFTRRLVKVSLIDRKASAENRARDIPLDKDRVQLIVAAIAVDTPMPSIVLRARSDGRFVIAGGNHRFNATLEFDDGELFAYVITCTDVEFETLCKQLNIVEGEGAKLDQRLTWAARDVLREGITQREAAERYNINAKAVGHHVRLIKTQNRLDAMGSRGAVIKPTHIAVLGDLLQNDNVLHAAVSYISAGASTEDVRNLTKAARSASTESEQVQIFRDAETVKRELSKRPVKRNKRTALLAWISSGENLLCNAKNLSDLEVMDVELDSVLKRMQALKGSLRCLCRGGGSL